MKSLAYLFLPFVVDGVLSGGGIVANFFAQDLGATPQQLGFLGGTWGVAYCLFCPAGGWLADRTPRHRLLFSGLVLIGGAIAALPYCGRPAHVIALAGFIGTGAALFWPAFETLLHGETDPHESRRRMWMFNLGWSLGMATGMYAGGALSERGILTAAYSLVGAVVGALVLTGWEFRFGLPPADHNHDAQALRRADIPAVVRGRFLYLGWLANFTNWFAGAVCNVIFPKLARTLHFPDATTGLILAVMLSVQGAVILPLSMTSRWRYRWPPMAAMHAAGAIGIGMMAMVGQPQFFMVAMALVGCSRGMSYQSSLYYGLASGRQRGRVSGTHEWLIGLAYVLGPLLGGWVAQHVSLRAPFVMAAIVMAVAVAIETVVGASLRWRPGDAAA